MKILDKIIKISKNWTFYFNLMLFEPEFVGSFYVSFCKELGHIQVEFLVFDLRLTLVKEAGDLLE